MSFIDIRRILDWPGVYAAWQAPFVAQKVAPFLRATEPAKLGRVLEIGCGPGTNCRLFGDEYVGIDLNPQYVAAAERRFGKRFLCQDAARFELPGEDPFDTVFINSLLHHLEDESVAAAMKRAAGALRAGGCLHVLDLVLPAETSVARMLAKLDRGGFARPLNRWQELLSADFEQEHFEPYAVRAAGVRCWQMVYFRGRRKEAA